jgi:hypothetical protein
MSTNGNGNGNPNGRPVPAANGRPIGRILTPRQEAAALALASGKTEDEAADLANCGERTLRTWLATVPGFAARVAELRAEMTARAMGRLIDNMVSAADTLGYLSRKAKAETVRLGAARAVLELGVKLRETIELEERIRALEGRR